MPSLTLPLLSSHGGASFAAADPVDVSVGRLAVRTRRLAGGVRDGIRLVELVAGSTRVFVLPDRGLGIWKIIVDGCELGWQSPVRGPVHPRFVPLTDPGGLGWLDGFDELVARCGLVSNGAPDFDAAGRLLHGLHGRISNLPAHELAVTLDGEADTITLTGAVDETRFLIHALRMNTTLTVRADRAGVAWTDTVENLSDRPATMQMLYHVNVGPPLLGSGAEFVAAVEELAPRDAAAVADVPGWSRYAAPRPGRGEQVHFLRIRPDAAGQAEAMLVNPERHAAVRLAWRADSLPWFTLWKNLGGIHDGYVTGLEPGTNFPNRRTFEEAAGRVVKLAPGASERFGLEIQKLAGDEVASARSRIAATTAAPPVIHDRPKPGWSTE